MRRRCVRSLLSASPLLAIALAACHSSGAVSGAVQGNVRDATTGAPVARAAVTLNGQAPQAITDASGSFSIPSSGRGADPANVAVQAEGYAKLLRRGDHTLGRLDLRLTPAARGNLTGSSVFLVDDHPPAAGSKAARARAGGGRQLSDLADLFGVTPCQCGPAFNSPCNFLCVANCTLVGSCPGYPFGPPPKAGLPMQCGCDCAKGSCPNGGPYGDCPSNDNAPKGGGTPGPCGGGGGGGGAQPTPPAPATWVTASSDPNTSFGYIPGCLAYPDGTVVTAPPSDLTVDITSFPAGGSPPANAPATLLYNDGGTARGLTSEVMLDVSVYLDGTPLHIVPGTSCKLRALVDSGDANPGSAAVFSADPATGIFNRRGDTTDGWLAYIGGGYQQYTWTIDNLQPWDVGIGLHSSPGGCSKGTLLNACDGRSAAPFVSVRVNTVDPQGTRAWTAQTDGLGGYCANTPVSSYWPNLDTRPQQMQYFISGTEAEQSAMCDPFPDNTGGKADCRHCQGALLDTDPAFALCTLCTEASPDPLPTEFTDTCAPPPRSEPLRVATLNPCTFCDPVPAACGNSTADPVVAGSCTPLPPALGRANGCACIYVDEPCRPTLDACCYVHPYTPQDPNDNGQGGCGPTNMDVNDTRCHRCTAHEGEPCDPRVDTCCGDPNVPTQPGYLACLDGLCVPAGTVKNVVD